jgi:hypothetical protein
MVYKLVELMTPDWTSVSKTAQRVKMCSKLGNQGSELLAAVESVILCTKLAACKSSKDSDSKTRRIQRLQLTRRGNLVHIPIIYAITILRSDAVLSSLSAVCHFSLRRKSDNFDDTIFQSFLIRSRRSIMGTLSVKDLDCHTLCYNSSFSPSGP